jgi:hypothetical protein
MKIPYWLQVFVDAIGLGALAAGAVYTWLGDAGPGIRSLSIGCVVASIVVVTYNLRRGPP